MKFKLNENIFEYLNKVDLDEELDPSINGNEILYEDNDYSKTPAEADNYRTDTEDVLGFELNGNQVQYLATSWPEFYHNAHKYESMKDQIIGFMKDEGLLSKDQEKEFNVDSELDDIDLDDIDYEDDASKSDDVLHPSMGNSEVSGGGFKPLNVQSWEPAAKDQGEKSTIDDINDMATEQVEDDDFDDEDTEMLNNILSGEGKK